MKQTVSFAASQPNRMRKSYRWICTVVLLLLMPIASIGVANAQSKDRDNPTQLTSNEISGSIDSNNVGDNYHYTFVAGPGEVLITLSVEAGKGVNAQEVVFNLFDPDAREIGTGSVVASGGRTEQIVKRINITRQQSVLLRIILRNSYGSGRYRLRLSGAIHFAGDFNEALLENSRPIANDKKGDCLPKQGTLIVKMKDGTKKIIDLSEAEEVTIVP